MPVIEEYTIIHDRRVFLNLGSAGVSSNEVFFENEEKQRFRIEDGSVGSGLCFLSTQSQTS